MSIRHDFTLCHILKVTSAISSGSPSSGLPAGSDTVSRGPPSPGSKKYPSPALTPGNADLGEKGTANGMNDAGTVVS